MLKESRLIIADYSSVAFDFAYMNKPLLYFQFDEEEYRTKHYKNDIFLMKKWIFGNCLLYKKLENKIEYLVEKSFKILNIIQKWLLFFFDY